ncbi:MAG: DNA recombination protein RmuC [Clostridia bacterium]|nr:DNA recombination protein RmuC [Clostridia bacterium]
MIAYLSLATELLLLILAIVILILIIRRPYTPPSDAARQMERIRQEILEESRAARQETSQAIQSSVRGLSEMLAQTQRQTGSLQDTRLAELNAQLSARQETLQKTVSDMMKKTEEKLSSSAVESEMKLDNIRTTIENRLTSLQEDNNKKLEQMRATVDEKLQKTLDDRISQSFKLVSERLEQVYKGLGEMQTLAVGVGDLKKVLSNVKTRGILGEIQLGAILEQILSPEQYSTNVVTKKGSSNFVEYAIKLPGDGSSPVYLPIDSKFPADAYAQLVDAYDNGNPVLVEAAVTALERQIKVFAKEIRDKYIDPPNTTDFGIMFLPFEGLYAEVVRRGLVETLQNTYKVNIAGQTTMAALLNSMQMGFRTLAIQKRSSEVWNVLGAVKTEFDKFGVALQDTQQRLEQTTSELDKLVGVRTRQIQKRLQSVTALPESESVSILDTTDAGAEQ